MVVNVSVSESESSMPSASAFMSTSRATLELKLTAFLAWGVIELFFHPIAFHCLCAFWLCAFLMIVRLHFLSRCSAKCHGLVCKSVLMRLVAASIWMLLGMLATFGQSFLPLA